MSALTKNHAQGPDVAGRELFYVPLTNRVNEIRADGSESGGAHVGGDLAAMIDGVLITCCKLSSTLLAQLSP